MPLRGHNADYRCQVRTGAPDDWPLHWPCDRELIASVAYSGSPKEVAGRLGVSVRTVHRWRAYLRRDALN